jgi:1-aminocyclopropane-1-carboxylate deaminase
MKSSTRWRSSWSADLDSRSVTKANIFGREIYIKRDDLFSFPALPTVTGNKVRKLHSLYYATEYPEIVISYGGVQSNAMRALAAVTKYRKSRFIYLTRPIPQQLLRNPIGSYREAIENNMELVSLSTTEYRSLSNANVTQFPSSLVPILCEQTGINLLERADKVAFVSQGVANSMAQVGLTGLAAEMQNFIDAFRRNYDDIKPWKILFASGSGISAYYIAQYFHKQQQMRKDINSGIEVIAIPCATSSSVLEEDLNRLHHELDYSSVAKEKSLGLPTVLSTSFTQHLNRNFGNPCPEHLALFNKLRQECNHEIEFDLLYAPRTWELLLASTGQLDKTNNFHYDLSKLFPGHHVLYYHCGGCEGNESQLQRYRHLKLC